MNRYTWMMGQSIPQAQEHDGFQVNIRKNTVVQVMEHRLQPSKVAESPPWRIFNSHLDVILGELLEHVLDQLASRGQPQPLCGSTEQEATTSWPHNHASSPTYAWHKDQ